MLFISGTGTGVGKTWVTRGLARASRRRGKTVWAVKPIETGGGSDAIELARAAGHDPPSGFYRARAPLAPHAAALEGEAAPDVDAIARAIRALEAEVILVEGAGGLLVPLDALRDIADLIAALGAPTILVARDELGVISSLRTAFESADARGLHVIACVLTRGATLDESVRTNARMLEARLACPILTFAPAGDDDDALADAAELISRTLPGL